MMHDDHHHSHDHHHKPTADAHTHSHGNGHGHSHGPGHNAPPTRAVQWQTPHLPHDHAHEAPADPRAVDLDLVEAAFVEGFGRAPDATSFLRVAGIPFVGEDAAGNRFHLLRVETEDMVDVGSVQPLLGGGGVRYDPLPTKMTSRRRRLAFVFHDGTSVVRLDFASARALADRTEAASFETRSV